MILYLWVALGSALGGVARYGFGLMAGRLWGEAFPWGTIAINVVGSFIIGFVATLTMPEGALPASPSLRTFVMVGICGGFTTFSSFSLQTLMLARDGSWIFAMGNVLLSVALCLLSVTLGHCSADSIGRRQTQASTTPQSIVAILDRPETARPVLAAARLAAERLGKKHIVALHLRHDGLEGFMPTEQVMTERREQEIDGAAARKSAAMRALFDDWRRQSGIGHWREEVGETARVVNEAAAGVELVVLGRASGSQQLDAKQAVHAALFGARRTTLVVRETIPATLGRNVAVAWKPGEADDRAIDASMPLLLHAEQVTILIQDAADDQAAAPAAQLARLRKAGVATRVSRSRAGERTIGTALIAQAHAAGADLLVMGADSHSRAREAVFGSATREILASADLPLLLHH